MLWARPHRLDRVKSSDTRGEKPVWPAGASRQVWHPHARQLRAQARRKRVAPRLFHLIEHVLAAALAVGVLDGRIDARKDPQVVEAALGFGDGRGESGSPGFRCRLR